MGPPASSSLWQGNSFEIRRKSWGWLGLPSWHWGQAGAGCVTGISPFAMETEEEGREAQGES